MNATVSDVLPKPFMFRLEFPTEVAAEREEVFVLILRLMTENTASVREACRLQLAWLERYPDDYAMLDLGESLWMLADAIEATTSPEPEVVALFR